MLDLFRAELAKIIGNRWTTGLLLWVFPVGALGIGLFMLGVLVVSPNTYQRMFEYPYQWTNMVLGAWAFPSNPLGHMFLVGLTAVSFAGEYQWGTWKNILPYRSRAALLGVKFVTLSVLIIAAFLVTSVVFGGGFALLSTLAGKPLSPPVTPAALSDLWSDYLLQAALSYLSILVVSIYVAISASIMRSVVGGVMVGMLFVSVEPAIGFLFPPLALRWEQPLYLTISRLTPSYNFANIRSWIQAGQPSQPYLPFYQKLGLTVPADSYGFSLLVLTGWVIVGLALILWIFQRQDISS